MSVKTTTAPPFTPLHARLLQSASVPDPTAGPAAVRLNLEERAQALLNSFGTQASVLFAQATAFARTHLLGEPPGDKPHSRKTFVEWFVACYEENGAWINEDGATYKAAAAQLPAQTRQPSPEEMKQAVRAMDQLVVRRAPEAEQIKPTEEEDDEAAGEAVLSRLLPSPGFPALPAFLPSPVDPTSLLSHADCKRAVTSRALAYCDSIKFGGGSPEERSRRDVHLAAITEDVWTRAQPSLDDARVLALLPQLANGVALLAQTRFATSTASKLLRCCYIKGFEIDADGKAYLEQNGTRETRDRIAAAGSQYLAPTDPTLEAGLKQIGSTLQLGSAKQVVIPHGGETGTGQDDRMRRQIGETYVPFENRYFVNGLRHDILARARNLGVDIDSIPPPPGNKKSPKAVYPPLRDAVQVVQSAIEQDPSERPILHWVSLVDPYASLDVPASDRPFTIAAGENWCIAQASGSRNSNMVPGGLDIHLSLPPDEEIFDPTQLNLLQTVLAQFAQAGKVTYILAIHDQPAVSSTPGDILLIPKSRFLLLSVRRLGPALAAVFTSVEEAQAATVPLRIILVDGVEEPKAYGAAYSTDGAIGAETLKRIVLSKHQAPEPLFIIPLSRLGVNSVLHLAGYTASDGSIDAGNAERALRAGTLVFQPADNALNDRVCINTGAITELAKLRRMPSSLNLAASIMLTFAYTLEIRIRLPDLHDGTSDLLTQARAAVAASEGKPLHTAALTRLALLRLEASPHKGPGASSAKQVQQRLAIENLTLDPAAPSTLPLLVRLGINPSTSIESQLASGRANNGAEALVSAIGFTALRQPFRLRIMDDLFRVVFTPIAVRIHSGTITATLMGSVPHRDDVPTLLSGVVSTALTTAHFKAVGSIGKFEFAPSSLTNAIMLRDPCVPYHATPNRLALLDEALELLAPGITISEQGASIHRKPRFGKKATLSLIGLATSQAVLHTGEFNVGSGRGKRGQLTMAQLGGKLFDARVGVPEAEAMTKTQCEKWVVSFCSQRLNLLRLGGALRALPSKDDESALAAADAREKAADELLAKKRAELAILRRAAGGGNKGRYVQ